MQMCILKLKTLNINDETCRISYSDIDPVLFVLNLYQTNAETFIS